MSVQFRCLTTASWSTRSRLFESLRFAAWSRAASLAVAVATSAPSLAAAHVWVVATTAGPGVDFTSIQSAIDAAASGDTIVVRPAAPALGYLESLTIDGKSLVITADTPSTFTLPNVFGPARHVVRNVPAGGSVVFRRLFLSYGGSVPSEPGLSIENCAGTVWLEESRIVGKGAGLIASHAAFVALLRSAPRGGSSTDTQAGPPGLVCDDSRVAVIEGQVLGGSGKFASDAPLGATAGGPGLSIASGEVLLDRAEVRGGIGGFGSSSASPCAAPGDGGPGIAISGGLVRDHGALVHGGNAGGSGQCGAMGAVAGPELVQSGGAIEPLSAPFATVWSNAGPYREGQTASLSYAATEVGLQLVTLGVLQSALPLPYGTLQQGGAFLVVIVPGTGIGVKTLSFPLVDLGPGVAGVNVVVQGSTCSVLGSCWAGSGATITILDASF